jgi:uncharacterized low-complexity protein
MFSRHTVRRSWKAAALMVALPLALASPAAASAGQQVEQGVAPLSQALISSAPVEGSCGVLPPKCTARLNRATTRNARDTADVTGTIAALVCLKVPIPLASGICMAAIAGSAQAISNAAGRYYEDGDCLAINIVPIVPPLVSVARVKRGDHNCS